MHHCDALSKILCIIIVFCASARLHKMNYPFKLFSLSLLSFSADSETPLQSSELLLKAGCGPLCNPYPSDTNPFLTKESPMSGISVTPVHMCMHTADNSFTHRVPHTIAKMKKRSLVTKCIKCLHT